MVNAEEGDAPGQGDGPQGAGGDTRAILRVSEDQLSMVGGTMVQGSGWAGRGVRGWGAPCPQHSPQPPDSGAGSERSPSAGVYFYSLFKNIPVRVTDT